MNEYQNWHPNFPVNLANCKDEPIQIPGAVQPFGFLVAFEKATGIVRAVSESAIGSIPALKDFETKDLKVADFIEMRETSSFLGASSNYETRPQQGRRLIEATVQGLGDYYCARYAANDLEVVEVELRAPLTNAHSNLSYLSNLPLMMREVQAHPNLRDLADFVARKIKEITGFDRVMVYQYDSDYNGEVIAEAREEKLETFFGLHYPASDIPVQARNLYERNWIRIIPTINYKPSLILPKAQQSLDLSDSVIRSVSPIHVRYLRNMGVEASMSISLVIDGKLWGLIACHHYSEHYIPLNTRIGCEAYGQIISWHIKTIEASVALKKQIAGETSLHRVLERFSNLEDFKVAARLSEDALLELFNANGMVIRLGDETVRLGEDPGDAYCAAVTRALSRRTVLEPLVATEVSQLPEFSSLGETPLASGVMALALAPEQNYYILCTRAEQRRTVNWAGDPQQKLRIDAGNADQRLVPRGSFALWTEMYQNQSEAWLPSEQELIKKFGLLFFKIVVERKEIVERSNTELRALNKAKDEFVATVSHELRTPLNAIIGWTDLALSGDLETEKLPDALKIIQRNAKSQNQLINDLLDVSRMTSGKLRLSVRNMRLTEIAESVALSFTPAAEAKKIQIITHIDDTADSIIGDPQRIQQVVWNILSNAIKFSNTGSKIWINVKRINSQMVLSIQDQGVGLNPDDFDKIFGRFEQVDSSITRRAGGLGLGLAISKHIVDLHGGKIDVASNGLGQGTVFRVTFPIAPVRPRAHEEDLQIDDTFDHTPAVADEDKVLKGEVILIVEDEPDASNFLKVLISAHGAKVFTAMNGREALEVLKENCTEIGIVLSDIGMPEMDGYALIRAIRDTEDSRISSVCGVALTAFGRPQDRVNALKAGFDSYIAKPVMQDELIAVLQSVCKSRKR